MLKYAYCKELFAEVPDEITLGISISGCTIHCPACHSKELWKDEGIILGLTELQYLMNKHKGITCLCLLGGEHDIDGLKELFIYARQYVKTAWYCGLDKIPQNKIDILNYLDFCKLGGYNHRFGGLSSPNTNQRMYKILHPDNGTFLYEDITALFTKKQT